MKKVLSLIITILTISTLQVEAQSDGFAQLLKAAPGDAEKLLNAYATPLFKGFGTGLNNGWTNTAKTKGFLHFEVRVSASGVFVPTADKSFDVTQIGLTGNIKPIPGSSNITPTVAGDNGMTPTTLGIYSNNNVLIDQFTLPKRITPVIPAPQIQATIGLVKSTDFTVRYIPKTKISTDLGSVGMIGFGVKHNIMNDIFTGLSRQLAPFDLAIAAGYSRLNYELPVEVRPGAGKVPDAASASKTDFSTQRIEGHFSGFNIQAIISKKLLFFTPFAAVGYNVARTNVGLLGNFPVSNAIATYTVYTDPVNININSINNVKVDAGFQLDLAFLKFYASGSLAKYKSVTAGVGLGF
ncbi:DUF6588 family protein [Mucilaginibacter sp. CSA2-8R]|uniref:DUF6588 family protein n=1 Tax=Mucilaginibacter sp. CSA2-8R TaxID=3141542 RepID=UPI00315C9521